MTAAPTTETPPPRDTPLLETDVADRLLREIRVNVPQATGYSAPPRVAGRGMEAVVYVFRLSGEDLPPEWDVPLAVRLPRDKDGVDGVRRQVLVQQFLADAGFPAPRGLLWGGPDSEVGRTFAVMHAYEPAEKEPGKSPRASMHELADFHSALHELDTTDWPLPADGPLVERRLDLLHREAEGITEPSVRRLLEWLDVRAHLVRDERRSVLHTDFLGNVKTTVTGERMTVDWGGAEVGDRHDDVARAVNVLFLVRQLLPARWLRVPVGVVMAVVLGPYRKRYATHHPLDGERLRYWAVLQTLEWALRAAAPDTTDAGKRRPWIERTVRGKATRMWTAHATDVVHGYGLGAAALGVWRPPWRRGSTFASG